MVNSEKPEHEERAVIRNDPKFPHYMGMHGKKLALMVSVIATTDFLLFGYDQGVMSGIISAVPFHEYFPPAARGSTWEGFIVSIYNVGCFFGAVFILFMADVIGRRRSMILGGTTMIIGVIIQITAIKPHAQMAQFLIGRFITGLGNGVNTSTVPTYQAECSQTKNRGLLICIEGGVIAFGTLIAYWIDYGCTYGPPNLTWRFPIGFQIVFALIVAIVPIWLPESPRWLLTKDRTDDAVKAVAGLRGRSVDDEETQREVNIIIDSIRASGHKGGVTPFSALVTGGKTQHFQRMMLGATSQFFQQIGGCNAVIYYFPLLFENSIGTSHNLSLILGGVNMIVYSIFATTSWFVIERLGRRTLFLVGSAGQCLSMVITFACLIPDTEQASKGAAVGLFTFIAFFGATWLPLPWLYPAEVNPIKTRAKANAVSTCFNWLFNFLIVMITPVMLDNIDWATYLVFAVINACFIPVIYFFFPETKMRSLEEIDIIFAKGYLENMGYVRAARELPRLSGPEIEEKAREYGFVSDDEEAGQLKEARYGESEGELADPGVGRNV